MLGCKIGVYATSEYHFGNGVEAILILNALLLMTVLLAVITQAFVSIIGQTARWFFMVVSTV